MATFVALLYSIVLTPERRVIMKDLCAMATDLGFKQPRTLASTGNLVFETEETDVPRLESRLEAGFETRFGKHVDIIVRSAQAWRETVAGNPFPDESERDGSRVALRIMRKPLQDAAIGALQPYLSSNERLALAGGDLWASFQGQPSESRLLGALTTKRLGIGTSRNWNTVRGLRDMLD
jgi:uncharacterized protein (DUF1697 family)